MPLMQESPGEKSNILPIKLASSIRATKRCWGKKGREEEKKGSLGAGKTPALGKRNRRKENARSPFYHSA